MSTSVIEQQTEAPVFDAAKFIADRNAGKVNEPAKTEQVEQKKDATQAQAEPEAAPRLSRSVRREMNRLREEVGYLRAKAELAETKPAAKEAPAEEAEPMRKDFASDAEYLRAAQKWDKTQEAKTSTKTAEQGEQNQKYAEHLDAMKSKASEDMKTLDDWDAVAAKAAEDEDAPEIDWGAKEHEVLVGLLANSDMQAFMIYHLAKNPDVAQKMYDLSKDHSAQIRFFHRLEGQLEKMYDSTQKAAQASEPEKGKEDRKHLADAEPAKAKLGETAAGAIPAKPKPSSEVAARGGSPAPDEPLPGSAAWIAKRNQAQFGR